MVDFALVASQVGHVEQKCMNKKSHANVSSIKLNSFYMLTKGTNGVKASSLVNHGWAQRRKPFGYQRS